MWQCVSVVFCECSLHCFVWVRDIMRVCYGDMSVEVGCMDIVSCEQCVV